MALTEGWPEVPAGKTPTLEDTMRLAPNHPDRPLATPFTRRPRRPATRPATRRVPCAAVAASQASPPQGGLSRLEPPRSALVLGALLAAALLATCTLAAALPQDGTCPDERASEVPAQVQESKDVEHCGTGLVVLGFEIAVNGERCPSWRIITPAHQACEGATLAGHRCVPAVDLPVRFQECDCERYAIPFLEIGVATPICDCDDLADIGHVEDFATEVCPTGGD